MKIINASTEILTPITGNEILRIEYAGRTCYKSEDFAFTNFTAGRKRKN